MLIEANLNTKMLAMISVDNYVFELIEKPNLSGKKVYPSKTRILLLFSLIGFLISVSFVLTLYFIKNDLKAED
jgi:LPS O-antigen subunit length determinant protein (WzzB/FepE family)